MGKAKGVGSKVGGGEGWSEGVLWGENGGNCTRITIKKETEKTTSLPICHSRNFPWLCNSEGSEKNLTGKTK